MKSRYLVIIAIALFVVSCAKRSRPTGGPEDKDAPILVSTKPPYESLNFKSDEIKIYFNEYIKLKDVNTQLIVSPPLKYPPIITPVGTPSKYIKIQLLDTLKENTTYTFNFGQSIVDNTEGNILNNFKYIFSTGNVIDSLQISGTIKDAFNEKADKNVSIMLYEMNEKFTDSLIYKEKPTYVANSLDTVAWQITNIRAGKYLLVAMNDASKNYMYNPKEDKIGFVSTKIKIPTEESYEITLFKEILPYELKRPSQIYKGQIIFGYQGVADSIKINTLSKIANLKAVTTFEKDKDSVNYWYKGIQADSLQFLVANNKFKDTVTVRLRSKKIDSLTLKSNTKGTLSFKKQFAILSNMPLDSIDVSKISFTDKDTVNIDFTAKISLSRNEINFKFDRKDNEQYKVQVLPRAIKDFYGNVNDTLNVSFRTKEPSDYGSVFLTLQNVKSYPIIVEIINSSDKVIERKYAKETQEYSFLNLEPAKYKIRVIYDTNQDGKWSTGNFSLKTQPEEVVYFNFDDSIRANFHVRQTFILAD